jgi:Arc/MetJ family transcription regulator
LADATWHWLRTSDSSDANPERFLPARLLLSRQGMTINHNPEVGAGLDMHQSGILMHMRTTMILNEALLEEARRLTGLTEKTALVHAGLEALIARESASRLADLGGVDAAATAGRRRRQARPSGRS